jgi:hypothetical protein
LFILVETDIVKGILLFIERDTEYGMLLKQRKCSTLFKKLGNLEGIRFKVIHK